MSRILLTGATGFVGMEVLARLLEETDHEVICVVRGDAEARLDQVLATLYSDGAPHRDRVTAIPGDLTGDVASPGSVDVVCHCAASISFDLPLEEARTINVEGTRTMLRVARESGARRFVHVSSLAAREPPGALAHFTTALARGPPSSATRKSSPYPLHSDWMRSRRRADRAPLTAAIHASSSGMTSPCVDELRLGVARGGRVVWRRRLSGVPISRRMRRRSGVVRRAAALRHLRALP